MFELSLSLKIIGEMNSMLDKESNMKTLHVPEVGIFKFDENGLISKTLYKEFETYIKDVFVGVRTQEDLERIGAYDITGFPAVGENGEPNMINGMYYSGWCLNNDKIDAMFTVTEDRQVVEVFVTAFPGFVVYSYGHEDNNEFKEYVKFVESSAIASEYR